MKLNSKDFKGIIKATFPGYRKRTVILEAKENVTMHDLNWTEGTKSEYRACTIDGGSLENQYDMSAPPPWKNPFEGLEVPLPQNCVIVEGGYFCGHERTLRIYVNPSNMPKYLENK